MLSFGFDYESLPDRKEFHRPMRAERVICTLIALVAAQTPPLSSTEQVELREKVYKNYDYYQNKHPTDRFFSQHWRASDATLSPSKLHQASTLVGQTITWFIFSDPLAMLARSARRVGIRILDSSRRNRNYETVR